MERSIKLSLLGGLAVVFVLGLAAPPIFAGNNLLGNGFPSGPHFNLNIHGKKDNFTCPAAKYEVTNSGTSGVPVGTIVEGSCPAGATCQQVYGNVIFVPRGWGNGPIEILMESGRKGPKSNPDTTELEVTDWCTKDLDGDAAVLRLPKDLDGYAVYARILGKPGDGGDPTFKFTSRELALVEDEFGNDLLGLGLITETGIVDFAGNELTRWDTGTKGKGVQKAKNITEIFEFTGQVCAINDQDAFCADADPACTAGPTVCCVPFQDDGSGGLEETNEGCTDPGLVGFAACVNQIDTNSDSIPDDCPVTITYQDADGNSVETTNVCDVTTQCKGFEDEWIFNIADFVNVLFGIDPDGSYTVQIRFYPLPLQNNQTP